MNVLNELKKKGVGEILILSVDGLTGLADAIFEMFSKLEIKDASCIG